jgi:uroporphyrinogen-III synthase
MRFIVTRPEEDQIVLGAALAAMGHEVISAPLLSIVFYPDAAIPEGDWQALLITSANGVRAVARHHRFERLRALPVCAVGDASGAEARAAGFAPVACAGGDVVALAELVRATLDPAAGPLLHVAGRVSAGDLKGALEGHGFRVTRSVIYDAAVARWLPEAAGEALDQGSADGALFYSPRTAETFVKLVREEKRAAQLQGLTAYCLSQAVADALDGLPFAALRVAEDPSQAALLALLPR